MDELERTAAHARAYQELSQSWQARAERAETEARAGAKLYVAATARAERAEAAIERVRALHTPDAFVTDMCQECAEDWPCPTIAALDSTQPDTPAPGRSGEEKICGWCANGDCVNCDWDLHIPSNRCTHNCLSIPVDGEERK